VRIMKRKAIYFAILTGLMGVAFYSLHGDNTIPDIALDSVRLLKKPIEELLPDLQEDTSNTEVIEQASLDLEPYQDLKNNRERWNEMRQLIETGQPMFTPLPSEIALSTSPVGRLAPAVPPPPGFTVQLPYESRLTVSGRKTIGITYQYSSNSNLAVQQGVPSVTSSFLLQQQLQVRINGQIGRKVTVNVDFDDTKEDKKDISIVYKGDPDEVVQRAAFGDITLSLPATEFAGYSKQVFGASAELKYKALHEYIIGSRTKGTTETKEFVGNVILNRITIPDTSYVRHKYYKFGNMKLPPGIVIDTATIKVYLDTQDTTRPDNSITFSSAPADGSYVGFSTITYIGKFVQKNPGIDYTIDPQQGIITFNTILLPNYVVAISFNSGGQPIFTAPTPPTSGPYTGKLALLKFDETDPRFSGSVPRTEDLTHYSIGAQKIVRDNGQGSFILQVQDLNVNNVGASFSPPVVYQPNNSGQIFVDFEAGIFNLQNNIRLPFDDLYAATPQHHVSFFVQYSARVKTYTLRPNIVLNSERILLNGRQLVRDVDYFIDYASGFVTFFNEDQITQDSRITATYDFSPFGIAGAQQDTLVGSRTELSLYPIAPIFGQSLIGSTVLYDFAPQQTAAPDIRQTAGSFLVTEADAHFKDLIFNPLPFLKSSFSAEGARSARNPNSFGQALIDNMEGIKDDSSVGMSEFNWQVARNPQNPITGSPGTVAFLSAMGRQTVPSGPVGNLNNETVRTLDINSNAAALDGDRTQVLDISYDLTVSTEASIVTILSPTGLDFTRKLYLEMYIFGDRISATAPQSGTQMNIAIGQVNEDADGTNGGGFTDINGTHLLGDGTPRTEDLNHNGTLDSGEDIGWTYHDPNPDGTANPNGTPHAIYDHNLRLDSEDLDRNGILNTQEVIASNIGYNGNSDGSQVIPRSVTGASVDNAVDFSGWKFVRIPLEISSTTATSVKELRISLRAGTTPTTGLIKIAKISVVGNRWVPAFQTVGSTVNVAAVNTEDDGGPPRNYGSPSGVGDFDSLNQINTALSGPTPSRRKEQALAIDYSFPSGAQGSSVTIKSVLTSPVDLTPYGSLRMFVASDGNGNTFLFRAGSDTSYCEFTVPVTWPIHTWKELYIQQVASGNSQLPDHWATDARNPPGATAQCVSPPGIPPPSLAQISQFTAGVINNNSAANSSLAFWVDEFFAADVITRIGYAAVLKSDFEIFGWGTFGANVRDIDANFQTFTSAITNQARHETNAYLNLTRLMFFPMKFTGLRRRTVTPNVLTTSNTNLVSILSQGRVDENAFSGTGTLLIPKFPTLGLLYDTDKTETAQLFRTDKTDHYGLTMDYRPAATHFFTPRSVSLGYKITRYKLDFGNPAALQTPGVDPFSVSSTRDNTYDYSAKLSFQPLPNLTFNPNYSLSTTREFKDAISTTTASDGSVAIANIMSREYDKAKTQTAGFDGMLALRKWLAPRVRYSITNRETYGIPLASDPPDQPSSMFKNVDRTATGETSWDFAWRDFSARIRPLQSLNVVSSYLIEDGDSWNKVAAGYNSLGLLSVRQSLNPGNPDAQRANLTLRDTIRSTQRWNPFDWATYWTGSLQPLRTLSLTHTVTETHQRQETTGTPSRINTLILPDLILSLTQTEYFFRAQNWMSNSQMNIKSQYKTVETENVSRERASTNGGDWRFTAWKKLDFFFSYTRTTDNTFDEVNQIISNDATGSTLSAQLGFNVGKWRLTPKYDQSTQLAVNSAGQATTDLTKRTPAIQAYADLFLPAGLRLPFADLMVFSNRIRTTSTLSLTQQRSSLDTLNTNTDSYQFTTSEDYELTANMRLTIGGGYSYTVNKVSSDANFYSYTFNSLLTIQF